MTQCVKWGSPTLRGRGVLKVEPSPPSSKKHAITNCCCHLANTSEELVDLPKRFRFLPNYVGLCWYYCHDLRLSVLQATFKGWMDIMYDAIDSRQVSSVEAYFYHLL